MLEGYSFRGQRSRDSFLLAKDGVAGTAFLGYDLALGAYMLAVVATETTRKVEMPNVVIVSAPIELHLGESRAAINALQLGNSVANLGLFRLLQVRVLGRLKLVNLGCDSFRGLVGGFVIACKRGYGCCLDEWQ